MKISSITVCSLLVEKSPQALPLGAACITSYLKSHLKNDISSSVSSEQKIDVNLCDFNLEENSDSESIAKELLSNHSQIYLFSVFVWNRAILTEAASIIRKENPDSVIIAGGPEVSANPYSFAGANPQSFFAVANSYKFSAPFDYAVAGEGEVIVTDIVRRLIAGEKIEQKIFFGKRTQLEKLSSPYLDDTIDLKKYDGGALWELARGCPFKCSYCYESKGEKTVDYFPLERIKKELDYFKSHNVVQIWVLDPTYNANKKRAAEILNYIQFHAKDIFFHFECRAEFLDKELVKAFSKINCCMQIGLQSADENVLRLVNRPFNKKDFVKKIALLNNFGIIFGFDLIYGLPGDTLQGFKDSINFALSLYPNHLELFRLSVLPGTDLFDRANELGLNAQKDPPYNIISTDKFSASDLAKAEILAKSCNLFYSQGRAVPWFNSVLHFLRMQPVPFFYKFSDFLNSQNFQSVANSYASSDFSCLKHAEIEQLQVRFIHSLLVSRGEEKYFDLISDIICLNGAYSRLYGEGEKTKLKLHYHPDDLMSEYSQDIRYFYQNAKKQSTFICVN